MIMTMIQYQGVFDIIQSASHYGNINTIRLTFNIKLRELCKVI